MTRSGVFLAPWMPAIRATASASPLGSDSARRAATASALSRTRPAAVAERAVTAFADTSTIRASPRSFRCGRGVSAMAGSAPPLFEQPDVQRLARRDVLGLLRQDDQRVGPRQVGQQMRPVPTSQRDLPPPGVGDAD